MVSLTVLACLVAVAAASHYRLTPEEVAAVRKNHALRSKVESPQAKQIRAGLKKLYVDEAIENGNTKKRSTLEQEAEDWLETIQEAKRATHRSMGLEGIEPEDNGLWQGDILLTKQDALDIIADKTGKQPARAKRGVLNFDVSATDRWVYPIKYVFGTGLSTSTDRQKVVDALHAITAAVPCLTFQAVTSYTTADYVMKFVNLQSMGGCGGYAFIGMKPPSIQGSGGQMGNIVNVEFWRSGCPACFIKTMIIHEVLHSLGVGHEQCRGDRDAWITLDWTNIDTANSHNFDRESNSTYSVYGQTYNYKSVMHYGSTTFALNYAKPVMTAKVAPIDANTKSMGNGETCGLVASDSTLLQRAYCKNPAVMQPATDTKFVFAGCYGSATSCTTLANTAPACGSGYTQTDAKVSCFTCGADCGTVTSADDWATKYYRSVFASKGGSYCPGSVAAVAARQCKNNSPVCADASDVLCGFLAIGTGCSNSATAAKCPKSCNTGACATSG